ncbi:hypothetical protein [Stackebrandtia soli]|uniref:hypothetical protein n=1 Tax=Stackebrandtia soli TaxID=1892856 RepID=UPI0039E7C333
MVNPAVPASFASRLFSKPLHQRTASSVEGVASAGSGVASSAPFLDVSKLDVRAGRNWLRLRLDDYGWGEPVPITLGTTAPRAVPLRVACGSERIAVSLGRNESRLREIDLVTRPGEPALVWVAPRDVGESGRATDRIVVSTPDGTLSIAVWVEPVCGIWRSDATARGDAAPSPEPRESDAAWQRTDLVHRFPATRVKDELIMCMDAGRAWLYGQRRGGRKAPRLLDSAEVPGVTGPTVTAVLPRSAHEPGGSVFHGDAGAGAHVIDVEGSAAVGTARCRKVAAADGHAWRTATVLADGSLLLCDGDRRWRLYDPETRTFSTVGDTLMPLTGVPRLDPDGSVVADEVRYFPPYLWRGPRPFIKHVPGGDGLRCGAEFAIRAGGDSLDASVRVGLLAVGGDRAMHWLPVGPVRQTTQGSTVRAGAPVRPGDYRLVVMDGSGVPSNAVPVSIVD